MTPLPTCSLGWSSIPAHSAGKYFREAKARLAGGQCPPCSGDGIIIAGGGKYEKWALAVCRHIRSHSPEVAVEVWALKSAEITRHAEFSELGATLHYCTEGERHRRMSGWASKVFAVLHSGLRNVLFLDADCFPSREGVDLLSHPHFMQFGAMFFQDIKRCSSDRSFQDFGLIPPDKMRPPVREFESGQWLVDKTRHYPALRLALWMSEHPEVFWRAGYAHGDKHSLEVALRSCGANYTLGSSTWEGWGIRHTYNGTEVFRHVLAAKRGEAPLPPDLRDCFRESAPL